MTVDEESIALLWTCVTAGGVDRDHVLCWFETNLARIQRDGLTERLFKLAAHYFSQPEVAKVVSPPGLNLLRRLCKLDGENEDAVINAMWGIALLAGEEEVSRDAGAFLTTASPVIEIGFPPYCFDLTYGLTEGFSTFLSTTLCRLMCGLMRSGLSSSQNVWAAWWMERRK